MPLNLVARGLLSRHCPSLTKVSRRCCSIYEPNYLHLYQPKVPEHVSLNLQIRGYVFPLLESYQKLATKILTQLDIDIENSYAFPHRELLISRYSPGSVSSEAQFKLKVYERDIHIVNVPSTTYAVLLRVLEAALPEGVSLNVDVFDPEYELKRYIPDATLKSLKDELQQLQKPKK